MHFSSTGKSTKGGMLEEFVPGVMNCPEGVILDPSWLKCWSC